MRVLLALSALVFAAAPSAAGPPRDKQPIATPSGKPIECVRLNQIRNTIVRDDATIDFVMRGGKVYRNRLDGGSCPELGFEERFLYKTSFGELCSLDTITVLRSPGLSQGATCGLGKFQPVTLAKR
jgi:hypothetical protein